MIWREISLSGLACSLTHPAKGTSMAAVTTRTAGTARSAEQEELQLLDTLDLAIATCVSRKLLTSTSTQVVQLSSQSTQA